MIYRIFHALLTAAVVLVSVIIYDAATYDPRLPIQDWIEVEVLNSPIRAGEDVRVRITREKVRDDCVVTSRRQAINLDGQSYTLESATMIGGSSDERSVLLSYPTPRTLPVGQYILRVHLTYDCPEFSWPTLQPDALFRVVE